MPNFISVSRVIITTFILGFFIIWLGLPWLNQIDFIRFFEYLLNYSPRYFPLMACLALFICWPLPLKSYSRLLIVIPLYLSLNHLDFKITPTASTAEPAYTLITANIGEGGHTKKMNQLFGFYQPDFVFLQENRSVTDIDDYLPNIESSCRAGICLMSRYPFEVLKVIKRKEYSSGYGAFAVLYKISVPTGEFHFLSVHMQSIRSVLAALKSKRLPFREIQMIDKNRQAELNIIESLTVKYPDLIVVGDFNLTEEDSYYQEYLADYRNALSDKGSGFTHTFKTPYHGLRIDHVLTKSERFAFYSADTSIDLGGDHLPVVVKLIEK